MFFLTYQYYCFFRKFPNSDFTLTNEIFLNFFFFLKRCNLKVKAD